MSMPPVASIEPDPRPHPNGPTGLTVNGGTNGSFPNGAGGMIGPGYLSGGRLPTGGPGTQNPPHGFDIWGPLQRRKYLIALFCLIGAALGYLHFAKTPKSYSSSLTLMISTQAPPSIVNGDLQLKGATLPKHASLIASELVISQAVETGNLGNLRTFEDVPYPVGVLKNGMLRVSSDSSDSETLRITCIGPEPDDLPIILNQVVNAYRINIDEDSQTFGEEAAELIQQLSEKLSDDKRKAEQRSMELFAELGINSVSENGQILNPYSLSLVKLRLQHDETKSALRDLNDRFELLKQSLTTDDEDLIMVVAIEAKKYLNLARAEFADREEEMNDSLAQLQGLRPRNQLETLQISFREKIRELSFEMDELRLTYGKGHSKVGSMQKRIDYYLGELTSVDEELATYESEMQTRRSQFNNSNESNNQPADLETFRAQEDRRWIKLYGIALQREQKQTSLRLEALNEEVDAVSKKAETIASGVNELNMLQGQIAEKGEAVRTILDQLNEMKVMTKSYTMTKVKVLDQASRGHVIAPSLPKSLALGTMLAFLVGFGLAVLIDQSDMSFRTPYEIFDHLHIPVVGRIPRIDMRKIETAGKGAPTLVVAHKPGSTVAEAFRDIRTSLFFQANADDIKTILFTSPSPGDGKSTTACNLALSIAQAGKRVLLIDADFRRPRVHQHFDMEIKPGLLDVLVGESNLGDSIRKSEVQPNLYLLTAGGRPKNPGELVTSVQFAKLIEALRTKFDFVLIDAPPVLPVSDPASIASQVDGVYLVTRIRKGVKITTQRSKETLDRVGTRWLGVIINGVDENPHYSEYGYQYGSYSYYGGRYDRYYEQHHKEYRDKITEK